MWPGGEITPIDCMHASDPKARNWTAPVPMALSLSGDRHQPEDDLRQGREPGGLAVLAGLVAAPGALGLAFVAASGAARDEVAAVGDLGGQVGGELVKELRGKSIRSR